VLSTSKKIKIARGLANTVLFGRRLAGRGSELVATRRGISWSLDLKEGIDLAIYMLGGFELRTLRRYPNIVHEGSVVLDIGANIGAHTLPLAQLVGASGKVIAFEPTAWAFAKQLANIALNPNIASRILPNQMMLVARDSDPVPSGVYSSWPMEKADDLHEQHHGRLMTTQGCQKATLDDFVQAHQLKRVDLIKLDVDGNENEVLKGAHQVIRSLRPRIMLELAPYVYEGVPGHPFNELLEQLWQSGYVLSEMTSGKPLPADTEGVLRRIPKDGGLNALAQFAS
jgi:FkbM family methyltransferase